jgi:hypothetical protein
MEPTKIAIVSTSPSLSSSFNSSTKVVRDKNICLRGIVPSEDDESEATVVTTTFRIDSTASLY